MPYRSRLAKARASAHHAVAETLREQGIAVRTITTRAPKTPAELQSDCTQVVCAVSLLSALRFDLAVAIALWQGEDGPEASVTIAAAARTATAPSPIATTTTRAAQHPAVQPSRPLRLLHLKRACQDRGRSSTATWPATPITARRCRR